MDFPMVSCYFRHTVLEISNEFGAFWCLFAILSDKNIVKGQNITFLSKSFRSTMGQNIEHIAQSGKEFFSASLRKT
jgi:hypothetical protein